MIEMYELESFSNTLETLCVQYHEWGLLRHVKLCICRGTICVQVEDPRGYGYRL